MKVSEYTIEFLGDLIAGDLEGAPYRTGPELVAFFNRFGPHEVYGAGFATRRFYARDKLRELNGKRSLEQALLHALDPRAFLKEERGVEFVIPQVNEYLRLDGYEVVKVGLTYRVRNLKDQLRLTDEATVSHELTRTAIDENVQKCEEKLAAGDYAGAITNARTLLESVLVGIEKDVDSNAPEYDGNLQALYKRVQRYLNLEPGRQDIAETLRQILSGFVSVVSGLAGIRNKMSDAHAPTYRPSRHHAVLAVSAAVTLVNFLFETRNYQRERTSQEKQSGK